MFLFPSRSLTFKIFSVNLVALFIMMIGVLYVDRYQKNLLDIHEQRLLSDAKLFASALQDSIAPKSNYNHRFQADDYDFIVERARRLVENLADNSGYRIHLYNQAGDLLIDSRLRGQGQDGRIEIEPLAPLDFQRAPKMHHDNGQANSGNISRDLISRDMANDVKEIQAHLDDAFDDAGKQIIKYLPIRLDLSLMPDIDGNPDVFAANMPLIHHGFQGDYGHQSWLNNDKQIIITATAPVYNQNQDVNGVVFLSRPGDDIIQAIIQTRLDVLQISALAFLATLLLSIYLAREIALPLRKLGLAADRIRQGHQIAQIPTYPKRKDEIGSLSMALFDMTKALGDRLDTIERFAGDVSHELKNPLSSMRSATETLQRHLKKHSPDSDEKRSDLSPRLMQIIMHDIERMNRLITDIARTSRLDVALEREGRSAIDLYDLLRNIAQLQTQFQQDIPIRLKRLMEEDFTIRGNADRLAQVFQNLLDNAVSFSKKGDHITISFHKDKSWIVMQVEDQGPGIPPDKIDAIFDRFYSERPGHEEYGEHSGLGLAIARQIIEAHHGDIRAENIYVPDHQGNTIKGARFIIRFPML